MSYAVHAYVVVGVRIKEQELWENVKVKACSHEVGDNAKFCPECGCPTNKTEKREIAGYDGLLFRAMSNKMKSF